MVLIWSCSGSLPSPAQAYTKIQKTSMTDTIRYRANWAHRTKIPQSKLNPFFHLHRESTVCYTRHDHSKIQNSSDDKFAIIFDFISSDFNLWHNEFKKYFSCNKNNMWQQPMPSNKKQKTHTKHIVARPAKDNLLKTLNLLKNQNKNSFK